jgi:hypothetical protein
MQLEQNQSTARHLRGIASLIQFTSGRIDTYGKQKVISNICGITHRDDPGGLQPAGFD